ncbi:hypothetical protein H5410_026078 [Solanum commersonii]|uniref:Uncharacterized protein n=1 Tax=Solanum commersonii TaxID=4109 RepID=A0A9J5YW11_SOLCO|nr:hypothetical protein H5410_026078 [Solanum commersonii]
MANFEHNVMVALYWGGEIITEMNGFRYTECARMIISMYTSMKYVELVELLHEKMGTTSENIQMDISGKYPCSIQEPIAQPPFQQLLMRDQRSFGEGSSSQRHVGNSPREYEDRKNETNVDPYSEVNAELSEESSEEDEPSKDDGESESDEDINDARDFSQNDIGINLPNQFERDVSEVQNHDVPYFRTLDNEEDVFMSTCESKMEYCSVWSEDATKDLKKRHDLSRLMWRAASAHQVRKFESLIWQIREENEEAYEYLMEIPLDKWTVTDRMGGLARNFVSEHFTVENYVATYSGSFSPLSHEGYWPSPNFRMESNEFYRRLNRSRTTRIPNEMDRGVAVYERACGLCRQTGHDRRRCPDRN